MVDITPSIKGDRKLINSYGAGRFIVNGVEMPQSLLVYPDEVKPWNPPEAFQWTDALAEELLQAAEGQEIVLVGTGKNMRLLPPMMKARFREKGISIDIMDTGAACRTYNVLLTEERKVLAALVLV